MQRSFLSARIGPISGIVGSTLVLMDFFLPLGGYGSEWDEIAQGFVDPMVVLILLAALAIFALSALALLHPPSPVLEELGFLVAIVGLLAQVYVLLATLIDTGMTLTTFFPQLFSLPASNLFLFLWYPSASLLGFLLSGCGRVFAAIMGEQQARESAEGRASNYQEGDERGDVWNIKKRHILAMIAGVLLYSLLSNLFLLWEGPWEDYFITVYPAIALILYFGVVYGPWVGLVTGGIGSFLNNALGTFAHVPYWILSNYVPLNASHLHMYWSLVIRDALIGLMAGLPLFGVAGRDKTIRSLLTAFMRSSFSIIVGFSLPAVLYEIGRPVDWTLLSIQNAFTDSIPTLLVVVLLLPLLFVLFPARITHGRERQALP